MTEAPAFPCPKCRRKLESFWWFDATSGRCRACETDFEFVPLPALTAAPARVVPTAAVVAADSVCFFHAENRAEAVCDDCGRLLCSVCAVPFMGRKLCPSCIAGSSKRADAGAAFVKDRVLYDSIALSLAALPVVLVFLWFLTIVTAPLALGFAIYGWKKPGSLLRRSRWRLVLAAILASLEIATWLFVLIRFLLR